MRWKIKKKTSLTNKILRNHLPMRLSFQVWLYFSSLFFPCNGNIKNFLRRRYILFIVVKEYQLIPWLWVCQLVCWAWQCLYIYGQPEFINYFLSKTWICVSNKQRRFFYTNKEGPAKPWCDTTRTSSNQRDLEVQVQSFYITLDLSIIYVCQIIVFAHCIGYYFLDESIKHRYL